MNKADLSPWLARGLYLFAFALVLTAVIDLASTVWPMHPGDLSWRYGFLGLTAGYLQTPTLGLILAIAVAIWQESPAALRAVGFASILAAVGLLVGMSVFALDVVQMRAMRAEEMRSTVLAGGMLQEVKYVVAFFVLAALGFGALKTAKGFASHGSRRDDSPGIVSSKG